MRFSAEDIKRQMESGTANINVPEQSDPNIQNFVSNMAAAAQNSLLEGCPVFIERLRNNPKLATRIKELMQSWSSEQNSSDSSTKD